MNDLHWSDLAKQSPEVGQVLVILELPDVHFQGSQIKEGDSYLFLVSFVGQHIPRFVTHTLRVLECSLRNHVANFSSHTFFSLGVLILFVSLF